MEKGKTFESVEVGPIRPPSEAESLLIRVTRNCPWNKCRFCGLYKGKQFSIRKKEIVIAEIDTIKKCVDVFLKIENCNDCEKLQAQFELQNELDSQGAINAYKIALNWFRSGMESIFLQDANTMVVKTQDLVEIIKHIKNSFPNIKRITSYARSQTIINKSDSELTDLYEAGLNRIHIGMETGSDRILAMMDKGVDRTAHITAGQKVKYAGFELSEYYMPGLGGVEYSMENARESADVLNQINPDFIRIRTLAIPKNVPLNEDWEKGKFKCANDKLIVKELMMFLENLHGITSTIISDHILNLIPEVEGKLPRDKKTMIGELQWFLDLPAYDQMIFRIGRRTGQMSTKGDLRNTAIVNRVEHMMKRNNIGPDNIDQVIADFMKNFI